MSLRTLTPLKIVTTFDPNSISGLTRWFDPRYGVTVNGSNQITNWVDQSSNADTATPPTAGKALVLTSNSFGTLPGAVGTQANDTQETLTAPVTGLSAFTAFCIVKPPSVIPMDLGIMGADAGNGGICVMFSAGTGVQNYDGTNFENTAVTGFTGNVAHLIQIQSGTGPSSVVVKVDGVAGTPTTGAGSAWNIGYKYIGAVPVNGRHFDGPMGPQLLYNRSLSDPECAQVSSWLSGDGWY